MARSSAVFAAAVLLAVVLPLASASGEQLMKKICSGTGDYNFCLNTFHQNKPDHSLTVKTVTKLSLRIAVASVTKTLRTIQKSTPSEKDQGDVRLLNICHNYYETGKRQVEQAEAAFFKGDYNGQRRIAALAMQQENGCNQAFKGTRYTSHPVYKMSTDDYTLTQMTILASKNIKR